MRRAKSGRLVDVSLTISPIRGRDGRLIGASKIARDITERKRTDEALREAGRQKDLFLAMLGHELRNPLAAIRHATSLLQSGKGNEALVTRTHAILERQGRHMGALIDGLLDLSRIAEGRIHLQPEALDLVDVCRVSCADVQVQIAGPAADLHDPSAGRPRVCGGRSHASDADCGQPADERGAAHARRGQG